MTKYYFELEEGNYGAFYRDRVILLRTSINDYAGLNTEASMYLKHILESAFISIKDSKSLFITEESVKSDVDPKKIYQYVQHFINQGLIKLTDKEQQRNIIKYPIEHTGLSEIEYYPCYKNIKLNKSLVISAFFSLHKIHTILRKHYILGVVEFLKQVSQSLYVTKIPSGDHSLSLATALNTACLFYPRKTSCLPFAATLALLHYKRQYECDFIIGVQNIPFYAHAWVEADGTVIHDIPELQTKLAAILRISPKFGII